MKRIHALPIVTLALLSLHVSLLGACDKSERPGAAGASSSTAGGPGTSSGTSGTSSSGALPEGGLGDAGNCSDPKLVGDPAQEIEILGDMPAPFGGAITPGFYVLKELYSYGPMPPDAGEMTRIERATGQAVQKNLYVTNATIQIISASGTVKDGVGQPSKVGGTYVTGGSELNVALVCPNTTGVKYPYSATPAGIVLFVDKRREVYRFIE